MIGELTGGLRRRYLSLGVGEIVAAGVFVGVMIGIVGPKLEHRADRFACWSALVPLIAVLLQGGVYWLVARSWIPGGRMPRRLARVYRSFAAIDVVLLGMGLVGIFAWWPSNGGALLLALGVWLFAVVEYINYFAVRLAYPVHRWPVEVSRWRTPRLVKDLQSSSH